MCFLKVTLGVTSPKRLDAGNLPEEGCLLYQGVPIEVRPHQANLVGLNA
jgi:hypothetical protein